MVLDEVKKDALHTVQTILKKQGHDISIQEIAAIVDSQFIGALLGFNKGIEVRLPIFGTFVRKHVEEITERKNALKKLKDSMSKEAYKVKELEAKMKTIEVRKKRKKEMTKVTFSDLKSIPSVDNNVHRYHKVIKASE